MLLKKTLNRSSHAVVLPLRNQWVLAVARQAGARPELEQLSTFERDDNDLKALKRLAGQLDLGGNQLGTLLVAGEYSLVQIEAPELADRDELKEALRWKVKDMVDFPVDQATLDFFDLPQDGAATGRGRQIFVVVAKNEVLRPKIELFQDARLKLAVIDIPEMGLRNIARLFETQLRGLVLLNFTPLGGILIFTFRGELCAVRRIEITLEQLETAEDGRLTELFDRVALEVQRSVDNFERQFNSITLSRLVTAEMQSVPGLLDYLRGYLSIKVEPLDLAEVLDFPAVPELRNTRRQAELMPVIGAALRVEAD
ncbi:MAG TPA: hypothetical protein VFH22_14275 [Rhodocyclaceae bacterium]|nr:hypothetical protein [Rhodocyclaceae bacterium]